MKNEMCINEDIINTTQQGLFDGKEIVLDYDIINDKITHRSSMITVVFGLPQTITHARDYLIRYSIIQPESTKDFMKLLHDIREGKPYAECVVRAKTASGELLWIQIMLTTIYENEQPIRAVGVFKDITKQRDAELQWNNDLRHRDIMMRESILYYEANLTTSKVTFGLDHFFKIMKLPQIDAYDEVLQLLVNNVVYPKERKAVKETFCADNLLRKFEDGKRCVEMEYRRLTGDGSVMWVRGSAYIADNNLSHNILLFFCAIDITDLKIRELSLRERAEKDALTGLYNKVTTQLWIQDSIDGNTDLKDQYALLLISLNDFERINERMGRYFGDALLSEVGQKLLKISDEGDIIGRNVGVELLAYLRCNDVEDVLRRAQHIYKELYMDQSEIFVEAKISASIGIALYPTHGQSYDALYQCANMALDACSYTNEHIMLYDVTMKETVHKIAQMEFSDGNIQKPFSENVAEYVFRILYESKDLNITIQGVLELMMRRYGFFSGYIYDVLADDTAYRSFECHTENGDDAQALTQLTPDEVHRCQTFFEHDSTKILKRETLPSNAFVPDKLTLRFLYAFKANKRFSGFIGFDYDGNANDLTKEKLNTLESVTQLLDVFLAGRSVNEELGESTLLLQNIVDGLHNYTYIIDPITHAIKYVNRNTQQGLPSAQPGRICHEVFRGLDVPCEDCPIDRMMKEHTVEDRCEMYLDSFHVWAKINASLITVNDGRQFGVFTGFDFTEHRHEISYNEDELNKFTLDTSLYDALSMSTDDYIIICDMKSNYFYFPKKMVDEFDLPQQVIKDAIPIWLEHLHEDDKEDFMRDIDSMMSGKSDTHSQEYRVMNYLGNWVWLRARGHVERNENGESTTLVVVLTNLGKKSKVDHLTSLLDKYEFEVSTRAKLAQGTKQGVMMILGLDNFRYINSVYGWEFGDSVLKEASLRMLSALPEHIQLYRLDGDKFGTFFPDTAMEEVEEYYKTLFGIFHQHRQFGEHRYYCTLSGGCSWYQNEHTTFGVLYKRANYALDCAKQDGKNRLTIYDKSTMSGSERLLQIMSCLNESVEQGCKWFEVYYQPQVEPITFKVKSAEALLRWNPPQLGMVSPSEFIPLLEQTGLIHKVGRWVLHQAGKTCTKWRKYQPSFTISVNISFAQLQDQSFLPFLLKQVQDKEIDPKQLHIEITESCIANGSHSLVGALEELRTMGFVIEMDDFGTGYSSLEVLKNAPADVVKIDHAFVKDITRSEFDATFISFVVTLCHSVHIQVCLEGVEKWDEYDLVEPMQLDLIQGFLFGKPQARKEFEQHYFISEPLMNR